MFLKAKAKYPMILPSLHVFDLQLFTSSTQSTKIIHKNFVWLHHIMTTPYLYSYDHALIYELNGQADNGD